MAAVDDCLEKMVMELKEVRDHARHFDTIDGGRRNQLACEAASDNYKAASAIQMTSKSEVLAALKKEMDHTHHWRGQFKTWGGHDNEYAEHVHSRAYDAYETAAHAIQKMAEEPDTITMTLIPVVEIHGGVPDGVYKEKKFIKVGYSSTSTSTSSATNIMSKASGSINALTKSVSAELSVDVKSTFDSATTSTSMETTHEKEFCISMKDPCYIYTASCSIVTCDGNTHTFSTDSFVQSSEKLVSTKYSARMG